MVVMPDILRRDCHRVLLLPYLPISCYWRLHKRALTNIVHRLRTTMIYTTRSPRQVEIEVYTLNRCCEINLYILHQLWLARHDMQASNV